jgi:hypothetical protein
MWARFSVSIAVLAAACGSAPLNPPRCDAGECASACGPGVEAVPYEGGAHVPDGTKVTYTANPPASGNHSETWQIPWGNYDTEVARERWVHNLEHGGIVLAYNCPGGCQADVDAFKAIMNGRPPDRFGAVRVIITPDPNLPKRFAAIAWTWRWLGDAVDAKTINCFIDARYDRAPESIP